MSVQLSVQQSGLTLIEVLFALMIGAVLVTIGANESGRLGDQRAVMNARDAVSMVPHRARTEAARLGQPVYVWVTPGTGAVHVGTTSDTAHTVLMDAYNVTMTGSDLTLCYTSGGYALPGCSNVTSPANLTFERNGQSAQLTVMPLGQMWRD